MSDTPRTDQEAGHNDEHDRQNTIRALDQLTVEYSKVLWRN
jgi:hypothetical protein